MDDYFADSCAISPTTFFLSLKYVGGIDLHLHVVDTDVVQKRGIPLVQAELNDIITIGILHN